MVFEFLKVSNWSLFFVKTSQFCPFC